MEEDIEIIESFIDEPELRPIKLHIAVENFLKGYRELEEKCKRYKECKDEYNRKYIEVTSLYLNSIPKSKIKEKIEEYKQEMKEIRAKEKGLIWNHRLHKLDYAIEVLQELMEE